MVLCCPGLSAEEFILKPANGASPYENFITEMASALNTAKGNVQIISVQDVEGGMVDVRYAMHGSPYYPSSQTDSAVSLNQQKVIIFLFQSGSC
jgi:hypothetical protein